MIRQYFPWSQFFSLNIIIVPLLLHFPGVSLDLNVLFNETDYLKGFFPFLSIYSVIPGPILFFSWSCGSLRDPRLFNCQLSHLKAVFLSPIPGTLVKLWKACFQWGIFIVYLVRWYLFFDLLHFLRHNLKFLTRLIIIVCQNYFHLEFWNI